MKRKVILLFVAAATIPPVTHRAIEEKRIRGGRDGGLIERPTAAAVPNYRMFTRPEGLSPLSDVSVDYDIRKLHGRKGTLYTSTGVYDVRDPDNQADFPADLRTPATHSGKGTGLRPHDLNYAILSPQGRSRAGRIESRIGELGGKVVGMVRDGYVLWASPAVANEFRHSDDFLAFSPLPRAHRIHKDVGRTPFLEEARAKAPEMRLRVTVVPGVEDPEQVERQLAALAGLYLTLFLALRVAIRLLLMSVHA